MTFSIRKYRGSILHFIDIGVFANIIFDNGKFDISKRRRKFLLTGMTSTTIYTKILYVDLIHENITVKHLNKVKKKENLLIYNL